MAFSSRSTMAQCVIVTLFVTFFLLAGLSFVRGQAYKLEEEVDLCSTRPGVYPNGEYLARPGVSLNVHVNWTGNTPQTVRKCLMRFKTCDYCRLQVQDLSYFRYPRCNDEKAYQVYSGWCVPGCTYLHLFDQDYRSQIADTYTSSSRSISGIYYHSPWLNVTSESKYMYIVACSNRSDVSNVFFNLSVTALDKTQRFEHKYAGTGYHFMSPFFPTEYVLNSEIYKYVFRASSEDQIITVTFDDWQLSSVSYIQFDRANVKGKIMGTNYRPWIISDGRQLEMTFNTGPYTTTHKSKGFRATYMFHSQNREHVPVVHTNCDQWTDLQESGLITFNPKADDQDYYDCIFVIKKHPSFPYVMVRVINYSTTDSYVLAHLPHSLEIHEGLTSVGLLVESAMPAIDQHNRTFTRDHVSDTGFYVRIKGVYRGQRDFVMSYTSFKSTTDDCNGLFMCNNGRCIHNDAKCNAIDNCGDMSDEAYYLCGTTQRPGTSTKHVSVSIIIPVVVTAFLLIVICLLIIFICRCQRLSRQARHAHRRHRDPLNTVSGNVSRQHRRRRRGDQRREGGGGFHDPPPSYEDVLSTTPIGYLNMAFSDMRRSSTGLIQPPSYDEATSPTSNGVPLAFPSGGESQDLSSDSSSSEIAGRSFLNLSSSSSGSDARREGDHQNHRRVHSSSSDSSNEDMERNRQTTQGGQGGGNTDNNRETEQDQSNTRHSIAKPEDGDIQIPVSSSQDLSHNKHGKSHKKTRSGREDGSPAVISEMCTNRPSRSDGQETVHCAQRRIEMSPIVSAPSLSVASHQGQARTSQDQNREERSAVNAACALPSGNLDQDSSQRRSRAEQSAFYQPETSSTRHETQGRPSPSRRVPHHILKARNQASHMLPRHMSKSMNDLTSGWEADGSSQQPAMPPREFSRSVHIIQDAPCGWRGEGYPGQLDRPHHHRSQTLSPPHSSHSDMPLPGYVQGQGRRVRSDDLDDRMESRQRENHRTSRGHPEPRQRTPSRPKSTDRVTSQEQSPTGEHHVPPATRPKPAPKPRQRYKPQPEPRRSRQTSDRGDGVRDEQLRGPERLEHSGHSDFHHDRYHPPHVDQHRSLAGQNVGRPVSDRSQHSDKYLHGGQERKRRDNGHHQERTSYQQPVSHATPRPDSNAFPYAIQSQDHSDANRGRPMLGRLEGSDASSERQIASLPYRPPGPPPYRPRDPHTPRGPHTPRDPHAPRDPHTPSESDRPLDCDGASNSNKPRVPHRPRDIERPRVPDRPGGSGRSRDTKRPRGSGPMERPSHQHDSTSLHHDSAHVPQASGDDNPAFCPPQKSPRPAQLLQSSNHPDFHPQTSDHQDQCSPTSPSEESSPSMPAVQDRQWSAGSRLSHEASTSQAGGQSVAPSPLIHFTAPNTTLDSTDNPQPTTASTAAPFFLSLQMDRNDDEEDIYV